MGAAPSLCGHCGFSANNHMCTRGGCLVWVDGEGKIECPRTEEDGPFMLSALAVWWRLAFVPWILPFIVFVLMTMLYSYIQR
jgi:hypothetical protein